jgi:hypothetical protein
MHNKLIETLVWISAAAAIAPLFAAWPPRRALPVVIVERPHVPLAPIRK